MKKVLSIISITIAIIFCFFAIGCRKNEEAVISEDNPYVGTWESTETEINGIKNVIISKGNHIITLNADGTATFDINEDTGNATWEVTNDGVKLTGDINTTLKYENDVLYEEDSDIIYLYRKQ